MKEAFESIKKGLIEAIDLAQGKEVKAKVTKIDPQLVVRSENNVHVFGEDRA